MSALTRGGDGGGHGHHLVDSLTERQIFEYHWPHSRKHKLWSSRCCFFILFCFYAAAFRVLRRAVTSALDAVPLMQRMRRGGPTWCNTGGGKWKQWQCRCLFVDSIWWPPSWGLSDKGFDATTRRLKEITTSRAEYCTLMPAFLFLFRHGMAPWDFFVVLIMIDMFTKFHVVNWNWLLWLNCQYESGSGKLGRYSIKWAALK